MRKYIENYINNIEDKIKNNYNFTKEDLICFKEKIAFFQHERLIHLLVTLFYVLYVLIFMFLGLISYLFLVPLFIGLIFLIFYIRHYFFLEHKVQYLYTIYDKLIENK